MGPKYIPGLEIDYHENITIENFKTLHKDFTKSKLLSCGNWVLLSSNIEKYINTTGTISNNPESLTFSHWNPIKPFVPQKIILPKNPFHYKAVVEAVRKACNSDLLLSFSINENNEPVMGGASEAHLQVSIADMKDYYLSKDIEIYVKDIDFPMRETVKVLSGESMVKTVNGENKFKFRAEPLTEELINVMRKGLYKENSTRRSNYLVHYQGIYNC